MLVLQSTNLLGCRINKLRERENLKRRWSLKNDHEYEPKEIEDAKNFHGDDDSDQNETRGLEYTKEENSLEIIINLNNLEKMVIIACTSHITAIKYWMKHKFASPNI